MISKLSNVEYYLESELDEEQILQFAPDRVVIATGAKWRRDGVGRWLDRPVEGSESPNVITPDEILAGVVPDGPVVVYDDDHYYIGGVIAEKLRLDGLEVTLITPANEISTWTRLTEEQYRIQQRILNLSISIETGVTLSSIAADHIVMESIHTEEKRDLGATTVVMATSRIPKDELYHSLIERIAIDRVGDCLAPGTIATAVYSGHKYARELDAYVPVPVPFRRDSRAVS
jgi:dimethylamine/trimethylamine dehydrogenase